MVSYEEIRKQAETAARELVEVAKLKERDLISMQLRLFTKVFFPF